MPALAVDALISDLLAAPVTGAMLRQDAAHFGGLSTADAERVRAHLLASLEIRGVPADVVNVLAEELRTSVSPVVLAGAARATKGLSTDAAAAADWRSLLAGAADRIAARDVFVRWHPGAIALGWMRTARGELISAQDGLPAASGVGGNDVSTGRAISLDVSVLRQVVVQDQSGERCSLDELLAGRTTLLAQFYTRCMNPEKCSLTVTRLAAIARRVADAGSGLQAIGMSYDPEFDAPHRLEQYGGDRGFPFGAAARLVRCLVGWQSVRETLRLQVGYGPTTVNEHAREVFRVTPDLVAHGLDADALADPGRWIGRSPRPMGGTR